MKRCGGFFYCLYFFTLSFSLLDQSPPSGHLIIGGSAFRSKLPYSLTARICHRSRSEALLPLMRQPGRLVAKTHNKEKLPLLVISYYVEKAQNIFNSDN